MSMQYPRQLESPLRRSAGKARLVLGARQTGKSTLFTRLRRPSDVFIDLQDRSERTRFARDPALLSRTLGASRAKRTRVLVDEVQRVPELLDEIQLLLDRHPGRYTFTLTGSSARRLRRGPTNLLPGRVHRFHLSPVCRWETAGTPRSTVLARPRSTLVPSFPPRELESMLVLGSLPAAYTEGRSFARTLEGYAAAHIEEEVLREMAARNLGDYGRFLELAALESGKPINLTKISQETGLALSTIRGFYEVLEDTLLGFRVAPFSRSGRARVLKTPRFFFFDTGVRNAVARLPLDGSIVAVDIGPLFEHWVACELQARIGYLGRTHRLSFFRTVDGAEVDFVVETPREAIPVEVKATRNPRPADARSVESFIERFPQWSKRGYVVCRTARREQLTPNVLAIPWQEL
jgi:predicted AAA+ superfamily ATPase